MCFLRLKKRTLNTLLLKNFRHVPADLYLKHGHTTQGLKAISGRILVAYFREEESKRFGNFGFIEARSRRERGIHARVHLRVKIYSLLSTANLSSVLSSR